MSGSTFKTRVFVGDFETSVYPGQTSTEVWSSAVVELGTEDVMIHHSIGETFRFFEDLKQNAIIYYHNLKFDGEFWMYYLIKVMGYKQAIILDEEHPELSQWIERKRMPRHSVRYQISDRGLWYSITVRFGTHYLEIRDSLKLLPFSVKKLGKDFKTKHQKLTMEYTGKRHAGCSISPEEEEYIKNDVLVVKECLEKMFEEGHDKITIASCAITEYKKLLGGDLFKAMFPNLKEKYPLPYEIYGAANADEYIRKSYKGGWCYVVKGKEHKRFTDGITCDVNSLYPSVMSGESGNYYPVGYPRFWTGNYIPDKATEKNRYFFIRIRTRFYLKKGYLPFIQIKGNWLYGVNDCLETSDYYDRKTGIYHRWLIGNDGEKISTSVEMTLTCTDYYRFLKHYEVEDFEILDGCYFNTEQGIFDEYIEKYRKMKMENVGALRAIAKLFLNSLYGRMSTSDNSGFKVAYMKTDDMIGFIPIAQHDKDPVYIPVGSAITSYARDFTIKAAQTNYYGADKPGFIYADTDSIHCDIPVEKVKGIKIHDKDFLCWKVETFWDDAIFERQKTYIEHVTHEDMKPVDSYYNIKCAGMPDRCKKLFEWSMTGKEFTPEEITDLTPEEIEFLIADDGSTIRRSMDDFTTGLQVPSKLIAKRMPGGIVLQNSYFTMRGKV